MRTRVAVFGFVVVALIAGLIVSATRNTPTLATRAPEPSGETSIAHFCTVTAATGSIVVTNSGAATRINATLAGNDGVTRQSGFDIAASGQTVLRSAGITSSALYATTIITTDAQLSVAHRFDSDTAPVQNCNTSAVTQRRFVDATTQNETTLRVALFNPFPDNAIADLDFDTDLGRTAPAPLQGEVILPGELKVIDVTDSLRRRDWISTNVNVRRGHITVETLSTTGAMSTLATGFDAAKNSWDFAPKAVATAVPDSLTIFNPSDDEIGVTVKVNLTGVDAVEPFVVRVPGHGRVLIALSSEARIPKDTGTPVGLTATADNNASIIARRF